MTLSEIDGRRARFGSLTSTASWLVVPAALVVGPFFLVAESFGDEATSLSFNEGTGLVPPLALLLDMGRRGLIN